MKSFSKNIQTVLDILQDEVNGDVKSALAKMTDDYSMTWVDLGTSETKKELFRHTENSPEEELEEVYPIKGRQYNIKNITESEDVVMIELIESYPDTETGKEYRTPMVLVLEFKEGKIRTGRHYCDPRLSYEHLSREDAEKAYKNTKGSLLVIK